MKSRLSKYKRYLDAAKKEVDAAVLTSQESNLHEFPADLQRASGREKCLMIARQMAKEGRYVINVWCMKNDVGNGVSDTNGMNED